MSDQSFRVIPVESLKMEDGAKELMSAPEMQPYLRYIEAAMLGGDVAPSLQDIAELGVRRISVGGALARSAWGDFMRAARCIAEQGRFDGFADAASGAELNTFFRDDR